MKPINEERLKRVAEYIDAYFKENGECPTFRQIKDACGHSSLCLVHADIARLKERGVAYGEPYHRVKVAKQKESDIVRYDFPFLIVTDALSHLEWMNDEERTLVTAQDEYLKGNYVLSASMAESLLQTTEDQSVRFGAELTLCWCAMYTGDVAKWRSFFRSIVSYQTKTLSENKEKELIAHFLTRALGSNENCPSWLNEGRFYSLRKEARPLANLLFVANVFLKDPSASPYLLEPLCSEAKINDNHLCQVYIDLFLASAYHYAHDDQYINEHLDGAIKTCLKHGWITPLLEMNKSLGGLVYERLGVQDDALVAKAKDLEGKRVSGFRKIYDVLVEKNPLQSLTFREVEIINYLRLELQTKQIAEKMYLSPETVKHHIESIYEKLGVASRKELKEAIKGFF